MKHIGTGTWLFKELEKYYKWTAYKKSGMGFL